MHQTFPYCPSLRLYYPQFLLRDSCCYSDLLEGYGLLMLLGSRHTTRPAHAGVGGHHTTVSSLLFIAYPQTRVPAPSMLGPYADATGQSLNPLFDCSNPGLSKLTNPYPISPDPAFLGPGEFISDNTLFHVSSSSSRHAPART